MSGWQSLQFAAIAFNTNIPEEVKKIPFFDLTIN